MEKHNKNDKNSGRKTPQQDRCPLPSTSPQHSKSSPMNACLGARRIADEIIVQKEKPPSKNDSTIMEKSYEMLNAIVAVIIANPNIQKLQIVGQTDSRGTQEYNLKLSLERAEAIRGYLIDRGISQSMLDICGRGELELKFQQEQLPSQYEANRRVEFIVVDTPN